MAGLAAFLATVTLAGDDAAAEGGDDRRHVRAAARLHRSRRNHLRRPGGRAREGVPGRAAVARGARLRDAGRGVADGSRDRARARAQTAWTSTFAPVFDAATGRSGRGSSARLSIGVAFARGLGDAACAKHFPGLGTAAVSTDERAHVDAHIRPQRPRAVPHRDPGGAAVRDGRTRSTGRPVARDDRPSIYRLLRSARLPTASR